MYTYIKSYIKSIKYIKALIQFDEKKIDQIDFVDETYTGLDGNKTVLRVFYTHKNITAFIQLMY